MSNIRKKTIGLILAAVAVFIIAAVFLQAITYNPYSSSNDFSNKSWTEAFDHLHESISKEYAFTNWKKIDWEGLYNEYAAQIKTAQERNNIEEYYIALRGYLHEIPDGHVSCTNLPDIDRENTSGGFGFSITKIENSKIIVTWVDESSPAWSSGLRSGAEIVDWNGKKAIEALSEASTVFTSNSATDEDLELKQIQYLVRQKIGTPVDLTYRNNKDNSFKVLSVTAYDDKKESLNRTYPNSIVSDKVRSLFLGIDDLDPAPEAMVERKTLENNLHYIKIWGLFDADLKSEGKAPSTLDLFRSAIQEAIDSNANGVIIDLRNNLGGFDKMAADILGSFYTEKTFYEYLYTYNSSEKKFEFVNIDMVPGLEALYINPAPHNYNGKVVALINTKCISSGEGVAMGIRNLPNGNTLGFYGTNGSFGLVGSQALMPEGLTVKWPSGRSLNENKQIQLDSKDGVGGVSPTIRIPLTMENAIRVANGEDVELMEAIKYLSE